MIKRRLLTSTLSAAALCLVAAAASAQDAQASLPKPTALKIGDLLTGELTMMRNRHAKTKNGMVYQLVSEPRRLPAPSGLCNLENGPETFLIVPAGDAQASQLKTHRGKQVSLKVEAVGCAEEAGQVSEAVVTKWSLAK
ncbi:hypothetical protein [Rhodopseudomonas sp. B29]|uniref:hypothetical protein n=1 Tax=Rhodopseudomonas sp. B29 TaxID=95607 RepID=UPI0003468E83|nr:hypothetical protein [Rhodopseudomonas sp. B29]